MKFRYFMTVGLIGLLYLVSQPIKASQNSANIFNDIRVKVNTGGNSGATSESGKASIEVKVYQLINGEELPPINISTSSATNSINVQVHTENASGSVRIETNINAEANPNNLSRQKQIASSSNDQYINSNVQNQEKLQSEGEINSRNSIKNNSKIQSLMFFLSQSLDILREKIYNYVFKFF